MANSPHNPAFKELEEAVQDLANDSERKGNAHRRAAGSWRKWHQLLGIPATVLAAVTGIAAFAQIDPSGKLAGSLALIVAGLTAVITFLNPNELWHAYFKASSQYGGLKRKCDILLVKVRSNSDVDHAQVQTEFEHLANALTELDEGAPMVAMRFFEKAQPINRTGGDAHTIVQPRV